MSNADVEAMVSSLEDRWGTAHAKIHETNPDKSGLAGLGWAQLRSRQRRGWQWNHPDATYFLHLDRDPPYWRVDMRGKRIVQACVVSLDGNPDDIPGETLLQEMARWAFGLDD